MFKSISNPHPRVKSGKDFSEPKLTDQSAKNDADINVIMKRYQKTGLLPNIQKIEASYLDVSEVPSLETAFKMSQDAVDRFYELDPTLRKLMNNDPSELENFVSNPENEEILLKYGVLEKKNQVNTKPDDKTPTPKKGVKNESELTQNSKSTSGDPSINKGDS